MIVGLPLMAFGILVFWGGMSGNLAAILAAMFARSQLEANKGFSLPKNIPGIGNGGFPLPFPTPGGGVGFTSQTETTTQAELSPVGSFSNSEPAPGEATL